jgi:aspartyl-tRNA(Asn)/glutamyl-tRNA(Gln) amidotransferase subunit B
MSDKWQAVIGLEVHAQLRTHSKLFSSAPTDYGAPPNSQVSPVCLGLPGALPVLNQTAVDLAVRAGLATNCTIAETSVFARKSYFYPDLPKGYQISQFDKPLCLNGRVEVPLDGDTFTAEIERIHMEEDAGKSIHGEGGGTTSWIDLNRAGVALIEIVGRPDLRTPEQAAAYLRELRAILIYAGVCDGNMEQGSLRCDANVSIRPVGSTTLGTRCEIKNMNSFRGVRDAVTFEIGRQIRLVESGGTVVQQTRLWDPDKGRTEAMRGKEQAHDYRYVPDPDLPTLRVTRQQIDTIAATLPELPAVRRARFISRGLAADLAQLMSEERSRADAFEGVLTDSMKPASVSSLGSFLLSRVAGAMNQSTRSWADLEQAMPAIAATHDKWRAGKLSNKMLGDILRAAVGAAGSLHDALQEALSSAGEALTDTESLAPVIDMILAQHAAKVTKYKAGKTQLFGFFMGQVMRELKGKADAVAVTKLLRSRLDA